VVVRVTTFKELYLLELYSNFHCLSYSIV